MNLYNVIKHKLELLHTIENSMDTSSSAIQEYISTQRNTYIELQLLLMKALDIEYPCHGLSLIPDMYEYYDFEIKITPKPVKNAQP